MLLSRCIIKLINVWRQESSHKPATMCACTECLFFWCLFVQCVRGPSLDLAMQTCAWALQGSKLCSSRRSIWLHSGRPSILRVVLNLAERESSTSTPPGSTLYSYRFWKFLGEYVQLAWTHGQSIRFTVWARCLNEAA